MRCGSFYTSDFQVVAQASLPVTRLHLPERRNSLCAVINGVWAARSEYASRWRIARAWNLAFQGHAIPLARSAGYGRKERVSIGMSRRFKELSRCTGFHDPAEVHHHKTIGDHLDY